MYYTALSWHIGEYVLYSTYNVITTISGNAYYIIA